MSSSDDSGGTRAVSPRVRKSKISSWLLLAMGLLFFAAGSGALYLVLRPVTLRIAVGPPGSDDQKLIQALAQAFAREGGAVRVSLRSKGHVDVARFAEQFGGGGHARASGLKVDGTLETAHDRVVDAMVRAMTTGRE